jgi:hypothetical protein
MNWYLTALLRLFCFLNKVGIRFYLPPPPLIILNKHVLRNLIGFEHPTLRDFLSYTNNLIRHILLSIHKNNLLSFLSLLKVGNFNQYLRMRQVINVSIRYIQITSL